VNASPATKINVNSAYFYELLQDRQLSLRGLAKKIDMEPGALSLTFRGERRMKMEEASEIAQTLGVPLKEIMVAAGVENITTGERTIPVIGHLAGNLATLDFASSGERVAGPVDLPEEAYAVLSLEGWLYFIGRVQADVSNLIARFVFAKPAGESEIVFGCLMRSHRPGAYNIMPNAAVSAHAQPVRQGVALEWAAPVLWIKAQ
jgi:transcriptional regulator with XRE-family HTH domain